ncbi:MAG TPA: hypothetical protein DCY35_06180 [Prolixibacteraceae bacterium]|nr:hypothetical protein [Prolixibacteraceae bacterium]
MMITIYSLVQTGEWLSTNNRISNSNFQDNKGCSSYHGENFCTSSKVSRIRMQEGVGFNPMTPFQAATFEN